MQPVRSAHPPRHSDRRTPRRGAGRTRPFRTNFRRSTVWANWSRSTPSRPRRHEPASETDFAPGAETDRDSTRRSTGRTELDGGTRAKARPAPESPPPRAPSSSARTVEGVARALALVGVIGGGAGGAVLVKYLVPAEQPQAEEFVAVTPAPTPTPTPPTPAPTRTQPPEPTTARTQTPEPKPPEPKPPEPKPPEPKPPAKNTVKLPGAAVALAAGGGGRLHRVPTR